ncbi:hypothetical protein KOR42_32990 [Thalassoglobus neptunius]|uniref:Uncharacterized protein n=1 Tax=Thalassoglobus neptunius TaxID=1938619 RepID=A0A5C5WLZ6_9PLAN|nr:hypothetical protein [Thalassoglobus neptunius]TWT51826.1 hypothetical protein KOR42_32990 [Thalassoglobus neptunius]
MPELQRQTQQLTKLLRLALDHMRAGGPQRGIRFECGAVFEALGFDPETVLEEFERVPSIVLASDFAENVIEYGVTASLFEYHPDAGFHEVEANLKAIESEAGEEVETDSETDEEE